MGLASAQPLSARQKGSAYYIQWGKGHHQELGWCFPAPQGQEGRVPAALGNNPSVVCTATSSPWRPERHSDTEGWESCLRGCLQFIRVAERFRLKTTLKNILFQPPHGCCRALCLLFSLLTAFPFPLCRSIHGLQGEGTLQS